MMVSSCLFPHSSKNQNTTTSPAEIKVTFCIVYKKKKLATLPRALNAMLNEIVIFTMILNNENTQE